MQSDEEAESRCWFRIRFSRSENLDSATSDWEEADASACRPWYYLIDMMMMLDHTIPHSVFYFVKALNTRPFRLWTDLEWEQLLFLNII
jgi:hypothetical protein